MAADTTVNHSIIRVDDDAPKMWQLGESKIMLCMGEEGDAAQFAEYTEKNVQLYKMRNGYELSTKATACFVRRALADAIRSQSPWIVHALVAGFDKETGPSLSAIDYLGTQFDPPYVFHGHGGKFCYAILDHEYKPSWTEKEGIAALKKCLQEVKKRFIVSMPKFNVYVIDKDGVRQEEMIHV